MKSLALIVTWLGVSFLPAETVTLYPTTEPKPSATPVASASVQIHEVHSGETLWRIAKKYQVPVATLKTLNHLTGDSIRIGQRLRIPTQQTEIPRAIAIAPSAPEIRRAIPIERPPRIALRQEFQKPLRERFMEAVKALIAQSIHYDGSWTPPGESQSWAMDCSNTSRWLMRSVGGVQMARTASDQYYDLRLKQRAWPAPTDPQGNPDVEKLKTELKIGDLLFWENTYRPQRDPPVTHVMIYLGMDPEGNMLMAGSQEGFGLLEPRWNGPDVYRFHPESDKGGFYRWYLLGWTPGRFTAYGRAINETAPSGEIMRVSSRQ